MRKLVNPLQYNRAIDELNGVRPLETDDIVRPSISIPVLNTLTDVNAKIVVGKFMRCTQHGHNLIKNSPQPTQYEKVSYDIGDYVGNIDLIFTQPVTKVIVHVTAYNIVAFFYWCIPTTDILIKELGALGVYHLDFVGKKISFYTSVIAIGLLTFDVYGFY